MTEIIVTTARETSDFKYIRIYYMSSFLMRELHRIFDVRQGKDENENIIARIRHDSSFHGSNVWALIFAILIASIGLNLNSIAVIIGAMLISPLMGPIMGLGLSLGINDSVLLRKSARNILIAAIVSIVVSAIYFYLSPINDIQSELLARTKPTIYDVLIAFFGGLIGVIASTRIQQGNLIPGVAIATALMPPLCTAGYGIGTGQWTFLGGALYLFLINCIFICLATLVGVKYLHLPKVEFVDPKRALRTKRIIVLVVCLMITPAVYFAFLTVQENNYRHNVEKFIKENFVEKGYTVIYKDIDALNGNHQVELAFLSKYFTTNEIEELQKKLSDYNLSNTRLIIKQGERTLTETEWNKAIAGIKDEAEKIKAIEAKIAGETVRNELIPQILTEAQAINAKVDNIAIGTLEFGKSITSESESTENEQNTQLAVLYSETGTSSLAENEKAVLLSWIKERLQNQNLIVIFQ